MLSLLKSSNPNTAVITNDGETATFGELRELVLEHIQVFKQHGLDSKSLAVLVGDFDFVTLAACLAAWELGVSLVPQTEASFQHRQSFIEHLGITWKISSKDRNINLERQNTSCRSVQLNSQSMVFFTSGSSGAPKAIIHRVPILLEKFSKTTLRPFTLIPFLLFDHMGGINTLISALVSGSHIVALQDKSVDSIVDNINRYKISLLPATPTFIASLLIRSNEIYDKLSSVELITYGAEPMVPTLLEKAEKVFPNIKFRQTYGLTETGVLKTVSKPGTVFFKITDERVQTKVLDGVLWIKCSSNFDKMYSFNGEKIELIEDSRPEWICTDDMVHQDGDYIRVLGRTSEQINVAGQKFYPQELENIILELDEVVDVSVSKKDNLITGAYVVATCVLRSEEISSVDFKKSLLSFLNDRVPKYMRPSKIVIADELEVSARLKKVRHIE